MIRRLVLEHFRNYEHQEVEFAAGVNALIGENGQGKTNILEALYYLALLRSFRTTQLNTLPNSGTGNFSLYAEIEDGSGRRTRLGVSNGRERRLVVDGEPVRKSSDFIARLICAPFLPEDLSIVKGAPGGRRRFLDIALCQTRPEYLRSLQAFTSALASRNAMLRVPGKYPRAIVTAYDQVLAEQAAKVEVQRQALAERLNQALDRHSEGFFPDGRKLAVSFVSGIGRLLSRVPDDEEEVRKNYLQALDEGYDHDCKEGNTRLGPQRSDMACTLGKRSLNLYGSEGECRTTAIALRLALLELLREEYGAENVTILVDDVLGELDAQRRKCFLEQLTASSQLVFAGTALPREFAPEKTRVLRVHRGVVDSS